MRPNFQQTPQPQTPGLFSLRQRLNSINSPFISPLRIIHTPIMNTQENLFDFHQNFQLEPQQPQQEQPAQEPIEESQSEKEKSEEEDLSHIVIDENNILDLVLKYVNVRDKELDTIQNRLSQSGDAFLAQLFEYLIKKFKKLRKTKQEMIKYSIRKAFRYVTDALKKEMPNYAVDSNQYLQYYFNKYQDHNEITVPFKKDSLEKTMNSAFLKKIFSCDRFVADYKAFLRTFRKQYQKDNQKKVDSMKEIIKQCVKARCFKGLDNFKRLPWSTEILVKLDEFSKQLLQYVPKKDRKGSNTPRNYPISPNKQDEMRNQFDCHDDELLVHEDPNAKWSSQNDHILKKEQLHHEKQETVKFKTKSVILLTPPMKPMQGPNIPDLP